MPGGFRGWYQYAGVGRNMLLVIPAVVDTCFHSMADVGDIYSSIQALKNQLDLRKAQP